MALRGHKFFAREFICLPSVLRGETIFEANILLFVRVADLLKTLFTRFKITGISFNTKIECILRANYLRFATPFL